jgi:hypothetical protein
MDIVDQTIETNGKHQEMDSVEMIDSQLHACILIQDQTQATYDSGSSCPIVVDQNAFLILR